MSWHDLLAKLPAHEQEVLARMPDDEIVTRLNTGMIQYVAAWHAYRREEPIGLIGSGGAFVTLSAPTHRGGPVCAAKRQKMTI